MDGHPPLSQHPGHDSSLSLSTPDPAQDHDQDAPPSAVDAHDNGDEETYVFDDHDSAYFGSLVGYDTQTISSLITDYRYENGRRYHAYRDGEYYGPNDEFANEIQDLTHHMCLLTLDGKLHLTPLQNPQSVLDLGTGTGIWAIEMADTYPSAHVVGTDLSPIQPNLIPPNCTFEIEDVNSAWPYPQCHFDFIHIRELFGCVVDWDELFEQAFACTKPGGYLEILEHSVLPASDDGTLSTDNPLKIWGKTAIEMGDKVGKSFEIWKSSKTRVERAGFVDVVERRYKWPINDWPSPGLRTQGNDGGKSWKKLRELGAWNQLRTYNGAEGFMIRLLTTVGGWSVEAAREFLNAGQTALMDLETHAYIDVSVVYGRKPGGNPESISSPTIA